MPLLDNPGNPLTATLAEFAAPFNSIFSSIPEYVGPDFDSFEIDELLPTGLGKTISLVGEWRPHQPFTYGGTQMLAKEYYPGNAEPTVQVLGGRENVLKINGRFKVKHIQSYDNDLMRQVPAALCDDIDGIRQRGSLVQITLGEWTRWGFIEECNFKMKTLADIEYEISFFIMGDQPPSSCKLAEEGFTLPVAVNLSLIAAATQLEELAANAPAGMSLGLFDQLNSLLGAVATALSVVTKFADLALTTAENAEKFANRAIGLLKYAQATISTFKRRMGQLNAYLGSDPRGGALQTWNETRNAAQAGYVMAVQLATSKPIELSAEQRDAAKGRIQNYAVTTSTQQQAAAKSGVKSIDAILLEMLAQFQKIAKFVAIARYQVKNGDTLQTISVKFYKTQDNWVKIYEHNKLSSTVLVTGTILEIPKL